MRALISCLALAAALPATTRAAETILPGYWESQNRVAFPGLGSHTDRRCITAAQVARFVQGPSNHIYDCVYPVHSAEGGKIAFSGRCTDKKGRSFPIAGHGAYTSTTLDMTADVKLGPLTVEATTHAHRVSDTCPAPQTPDERRPSA